MKHRYSLAGRTVLITGSTGGLGQLLGVALRRRGANLALLDLNADLVQAQAEALGTPQEVRAWQADVRDLAALERACAEAAAHFGGLDVVVAAAGVDYMAPFADIDPVIFERLIDINLTGVWRTFRAALPYVEQRRGYLMAVSSMAAFVHSPLHAPYSASKAGVLALCNSLRLELRPLGVGVGSIHPTFFDTPIMANAHISPANKLVWNNHQDLFWKLTTPEEVVLALVEGIERRAELVTVPRELKGVGLLAGLLRPLTEPFIFPRRRIQQAVELAQQKLREREG